jgi:ABC-type hemin transport system substrate-binding protein
MPFARKHRHDQRANISKVMKHFPQLKKPKKLMFLYSLNGGKHKPVA